MAFRESILTNISESIENKFGRNYKSVKISQQNLSEVEKIQIASEISVNVVENDKNAQNAAQWFSKFSKR